MLILGVGHTINGVLRDVFIGALLKPIAGIINMLYGTIIKIAKTPIVSGTLAFDIFNRIQLILAVFMIFRIMITVIQLIISPDSGKNEEGHPKGGTRFTVIIKRILLGLILLVLLRPVNIPITGTGGQRQLNEYVRNHGIIFGLMYDLQYRILDNNNIGCLISSTSCNTNLEDGEDPTTKFSDYLVASFVHPNDNEECKPETDYIDEYNNGTMTADQLLSRDVYKDDCKSVDEFTFQYNYIILFAGFFVVIYVLVGFLIDIGLRSIKLSVLRLISPIPVISYMANEKDGILSNWTKNLINTYVDLFIRLALILFAFTLVGELLNHQSYLSEDGLGLAKLFITLSLLIFIRIAPKYIMDILGIKGTGSNFGLSALGAGVGALRTGGRSGDVRDAIQNNVHDNTAAFNQGKQLIGAFGGYTQGADMMSKRLTGDPNMTWRELGQRARRARRMHFDERFTEAENRLADARTQQGEASTLTNQFKKHGWDGLSNTQQRNALSNLSEAETQDLQHLNDMIDRASDGEAKDRMIAKRNQFYQTAVDRNQSNADTTLEKAQSLRDKYKKYQDNLGLQRVVEARDYEDDFGDINVDTDEGRALYAHYHPGRAAGARAAERTIGFARAHEPEFVREGADRVRGAANAVGGVAGRVRDRAAQAYEDHVPEGVRTRVANGGQHVRNLPNSPVGTRVRGSRIYAGRGTGGTVRHGYERNTGDETMYQYQNGPNE